MNTTDLSIFPIISWIDVARRLAEIPMQSTLGNSLRNTPPPELIASEVFWTGLTLTVETAESIPLINDWLKIVFGTWIDFQSGKPLIRLAGPNSRSFLNVNYDISGPIRSKKIFRPQASLEANRSYSVDFPERNDSSPTVVAFHSVKGGVGRTTTAMAFAHNIATSLPSKGRVLLVDADFEAPGASYLYQTRKPDINISLEDLMAIAHADASDDMNETIDFVATQMLDQRIDDIFVLPVKRLLDDLTGFAIRPEHLVNARRNQPFLIVDLVRKLAEKLKCQVAVVDLRAGLVDIAIHFLTDPTVERVFVTTSSGQSINALKGMLRTIGLTERQTGEAGRQPFVLINQVPRSQYDDPVFRGQLQAQLEAQADVVFLPPKLGSLEDGVDVTPARESSLAFGFHYHVAELVASANDWNSYLNDLKKTGFSQSLKDEMAGWLESRQINIVSLKDISPISVARPERSEACSLLAKFASKLEFAETAANFERPLITPPLQRLLSDFVHQPPIAVIEGTKGTGKTLSFRYLLENQSWRNAAAVTLDDSDATFEGLLLPILGSINSSDGMQKLVADGRKRVAFALKSSVVTTFSTTTSAIRDGINAKFDINQWTNFWLDSIASSAGFNNWELFLTAVKGAPTTRPIALFEGLEEVFANPYTEVVQADALRSLLREVPIRLREEAGRPIGLLIFARSDMVEAVIEQNVQQFRASYRSYALTWLDLDIQELAVWLVSNSQAIPGLWSPDWRQRSDAEREMDLQKIWGLKLGSDVSKEARSTEWVIAVLTDLTGRLTARDLVRFINEAALGSRDQQAENRLLTPGAMRKAVEYTSKQKVDEYPKEVRELLPIFNKLKAIQNLTTPFDRMEASSNGIEPHELDILEKYGVAYSEEGSFEVPELFRIGLNMKRKGARPNIISLTRKARERAKA
ncbi:KGGVGR-motif variant AAA ATPase [Janthinobacterium sp. RA13]|uniref:KGGVGR-motif variant AAA ATPase n=1 Tax=Janthinobacterium sp. RA13 TaxID=1502762 RepID=UPI0009DDC2F6|nr:AAA family ATPase [Janthinobacterium sp. RA13]